MTLILSIETSTNVCSVAIHDKGQLRACRLHKVEKSHSSLLPGIVEEALKEAHYSYYDLDAVAVSSGPGSYTGLRIGVVNAKGFCYTLSIPLLAIHTLDILIERVKGQVKGLYYLCPMLDARRMEVYTKLVDQDFQETWALQPKILRENTFESFDKPVYLFGNGMPKFQRIATQENLLFMDDIYPDAAYMGSLAFEKFRKGQFENLAYFEPNYLKKWQTTIPKKLS